MQIVSVYFNMHIHSQNGLKQSYDMATIISQSFTVNQNYIEISPSPNQRLKQEQYKDVKLHERKIYYFKGDKNPTMTKEFCSLNILPLMIFCEFNLISMKFISNTRGRLSNSLNVSLNSDILR